MKKYFFRLAGIILTIAGAAVINSCVKEGNDTLVLKGITHEIDVNDPVKVFNSIGINNGKKNTGNMPASNGGNNNLSTSIQSVQVNSGGKNFIAYYL